MLNQSSHLFIQDISADEPVVERPELAIALEGVVVEVQLPLDAGVGEVGVDFFQGRLKHWNEGVIGATPVAKEQ